MALQELLYHDIERHTNSTCSTWTTYKHRKALKSLTKLMMKKRQTTTTTTTTKPYPTKWGWKKDREQVKITSNINNSQVFYLFKYHFSFHLCKLQPPMHKFLQWGNEMNERTSKIRIAFTVPISSPTTMILLSKTHENTIQTLILIFSFQQQN